VILVVEDDQAIQGGIVEDVLSEGGFEVAIAASGEEAVTLLSGETGQYQALVTDIGLLGRFDGWEVARRARKTNPDFPVVYMIILSTVEKRPISVDATAPSRRRSGEQLRQRA